MNTFKQEYVDSYLIDLVCNNYLLKVSDQQFDAIGKDMVKEFLADTTRHNPKDAWNFCKHLLDMIVNGGLASAFEMRLLDLERVYLPPEGAYCQQDGSIHNAPWRKQMAKDMGYSEEHT